MKRLHSLHGWGHPEKLSTHSPLEVQMLFPIAQRKGKLEDGGSVEEQWVVSQGVKWIVVCK